MAHRWHYPTFIAIGQKRSRIAAPYEWSSGSLLLWGRRRGACAADAHTANKARYLPAAAAAAEATGGPRRVGVGFAAGRGEGEGAGLGGEGRCRY